ncbi:MAG TPA: hypothetical protein VKV73_01615 [Chloroflexota bacterium]|nr:hypothetical protein [Chloroflexota bacterium]
MSEAPRSNRPTPRTTAAIEAELRRQIRADLAQARADSDGALDDESLASIIAHAIGMVLAWHQDSPEHTRNATTSSRTWRPAGGPRAGRPQEFEARSFDERGPRQFDDRRRGPPPDRGPSQDRGGYQDRGPYQPDRPPYQDRPARDFDDRNAPRRGPREDDRDFQPRRGPSSRPSGFNQGPRSGGRPPGRGGGFGPRRPPPRSR